MAFCVLLAASLRQPVEVYTVEHALHEGDVLNVGGTMWQVLHTPSYTSGLLGLNSPQQHELIVGDVVHRGDIEWLNPYREGINKLRRVLHVLSYVSQSKMHWDP
jgi:glyoxylase-like metal-dependent hydrolase (beta-lactamase superfamily II)